MFVDKFYNQTGSTISFTRRQASDFAKQVADDFNPLHNEDAKRFCVPGDLLFAVTLAQAGLSEQMSFNFSGMVTDGIDLHFPQTLSNDNVIADDKGKEYLTVNAAGTTIPITQH